MSTSQQTRIHNSDGILHIELNRPDKMNALTQAMYADLNAVMEQAQSDSVKVIYITASGEHFTAGNDIADFMAATGNLDESEVVKLLFNLLRCPKPIVAAVQGNAVGIGTTMLLHCDLVVAADSTRFSMPFTSLGLCPEAGASWFFPRLAGHQKAAEWLLLGESFSAEEAQHIGLVNKVTAVDEQFSVAEAYCQKLLKLPMDALITSKALLKTEQQTLEPQMRKEVEEFARLLVSPEAKARFQAFLSR